MKILVLFGHQGDVNKFMSGFNKNGNGNYVIGEEEIEIRTINTSQKQDITDGNLESVCDKVSEVIFVGSNKPKANQQSTEIIARLPNKQIPVNFYHADVDMKTPLDFLREDVLPEIKVLIAGQNKSTGPRFFGRPYKSNSTSAPLKNDRLIELSDVKSTSGFR